jgi:hypothetical protein
MRATKPIFVALVAVFVFAETRARAEIVLDDFDVPFQLSFPQDTGSAHAVHQSGIGLLAASRTSQLVVPFTVAPTGSADANLSRPSFMTFRIDDLNHTGDPVYVELEMLYAMSAANVSQGGANDRVILDFSSLQSAIGSVAKIDVSFKNASQIIYNSELSGIPPHTSAFTLEFPFSSFATRGGVADPSEFTHLNNLSVDIYPIRTDGFAYTGPDSIFFSTALDRIRFGASVPEPTTSTFIYAAFVGGCFIQAWKFRRRYL